MKNENNMNYIICYKDLYISSFSIDNYDSELHIHFTSLLSDAKRFNLENIKVSKIFLDLYFDDLTILSEERSEDDA